MNCKLYIYCHQMYYKLRLIWYKVEIQSVEHQLSDRWIFIYKYTIYINIKYNVYINIMC